MQPFCVRVQVAGTHHAQQTLYADDVMRQPLIWSISVSREFAA